MEANVSESAAPTSTAPFGAHPGIKPTLKHSRAYRWRISISAISILTTIGLIALLERPRDLQPVQHLMLWSAGGLLLIGGILVRLWSASCLGGRKTSELVCVGPYSLCRNPLYVGTLLIALSQPFFYESPWVLLGLAVPLLIYAFGVVPAEERKLRVRLGNVYHEYCRTVPRWWPRWSGFVPAAASGSTRSSSFRLELGRSVCWLCLPLLAAGIAAIRAGIR